MADDGELSGVAETTDICGGRRVEECADARSSRSGGLLWVGNGLLIALPVLLEREPGKEEASTATSFPFPFPAMWVAEEPVGWRI